MASSASTRLRLELQADGENDSTWGSKANTVFQLIEEATDGYLSKSVAGSSNVTLTATNFVSDESRQRILEFTGVLTGNIDVIVPAQEKWYIIFNNTSGAFTLTLKPSGGTGVAVTQGNKGVFYTDGSTMFQVVDNTTSSVVDDTSPQLGGFLDTNAKSITFSEGGNVASASDCDIWAGADGNTVHITGTTDIDDFGTPAKAGDFMLVIFDGVLTVNDSATITVDGNANFTTAAEDMALVYAETTSTFKFKPLPNQGISTAMMQDNAVTLAKMAGITRGGLIYGDASGDPAELAVGTADQVLTSDGTDFSWAAAGGGWVTISSTTLSSDANWSQTLDNTTYSSFQILVESVVPATDNVQLILRTSTDGGSTYDSGGGNYAHAGQLAVEDGSEDNSSLASASATSIELASNVGSAAGENVSGTVWMNGTVATNFTQTHSLFTLSGNDGQTRVGFGGGERLSAADVDAVRILFSSGNMASGKIVILGRKI